jgi:hypothetical protein
MRCSPPLSRVTINRAELDDPTISDDTLSRIAEALDTTVGELRAQQLGSNLAETGQAIASPVSLESNEALIGAIRQDADLAAVVLYWKGLDFQQRVLVAEHAASMYRANRQASSPTEARVGDDGGRQDSAEGAQHPATMTPAARRRD